MTRGDICFVENGKVVCTSSNMENYPQNNLLEIWNYLIHHNYNEYVAEVKAASYGGFRSIEYDGEHLGEFYNDSENSYLYDCRKETFKNDYSYIVYPNLKIEILNYGELYFETDWTYIFEYIFGDKSLAEELSTIGVKL